MKKISDKLIFKTTLSALLMVVSLCSFATDIIVENGYVRESIPGNYMTSAYMTIKNNKAVDVRLVGIKGNFSPMIEMHEHIMNDGMMRMQQIDAITIPANGEVVLQPMGYHLMIFKLKAPLKDKEQVDITLVFDQHSDLTVTLPVQSIKKVSHQH